MRRVGLLAGACLTLAMIAAGCSGGSPKPGTSTARRGRVVQGLSGLAPRGCNRATTTGPALNRVRTSMVRFSDTPFGVVTTAVGGWSFVSLASRLAVMTDRGFTPKLARLVMLGSSLGETLTHDGRYLLVAGGSGANVLSVARLERGARHPVLGTLSSTNSGRAGGGGGGAIEVTTSRDDHYAFVSLEGSGEIATYDLRAALAQRLHRSGFIGMIRVGEAPVGLAVSPDGRWLYATSEVASSRRSGGQGTVSVIDVARAATRPSTAVVATVAARCSPVRVAVSPDGRVVWVTARESNELLGFSAAKLIGDRRHALLATVTVGQSPVGLAVVGGGRRIVVADSNRFALGNARTGLTVVDPAAALAGRPAVLGTVRAGGFPREMSLEPGGETLLVTNFSSGQVEAVRTADLP